MTPIVRHAALMAAGSLLVFTAFIVAATLRRKRWWLLLHRSAGLAGTSVILLGAVAAVAVIAFSTGRHLRAPHTWLGAVTISALVSDSSTVSRVTLYATLGSSPAYSSVEMAFNGGSGRYGR